MAWFDEAIFYHIYPLGLTGAPKRNPYGAPEHRLNTLLAWIPHIREIGCNALYIGPLFESVGHGYETTDYRKLDGRLGTNEDLKRFVDACHEQGIRVIFDGVFNHVGRDFFAFQDLKNNRASSRYRDWFCNVNFGGNNEYNDGFSYENWGGYNLLVKLNQKNPEVIDYICDVIRFWVREFDVDGIRLDAADVLDMDFMRTLRGLADELKPEFWLMGEVIHGEYSRWVNEGTLHSVTNYHLHKALYSGHNDHNYFEIAHTVKRLCDMGGSRPGGLKLYNFTDNHDVERIYTKLNNKAHYAPVHILLYTLPGVPSVYYGSEFGIEGKKERFSDDSLRPALRLDDFSDAVRKNRCTGLIAALGKVRRAERALSYGDYKELVLTNRQYAFSRSFEGRTVLVTVNNDDQDAQISLPAGNAAAVVGALSGVRAAADGGRIQVCVSANSGEIWLPATEETLPESTKGKSGKGIPESAKGKSGGGIPESAKGKSGKGIPESAKGKSGKGIPESAKGKSGEEITKSSKRKSGGEVQEPAEEKFEKPIRNPVADKPEPDVTAPKPGKNTQKTPAGKSFEEMTVEELQLAILEKMAKNGPVTDEMRRTVEENIWHDSLVNWVKSFR